VTKPSPSAVAQTLGVIVVVAVILFGAAGRIDIPMFWLYVAVIAAISAAGLFLIDEDLAQERRRPGGQPPGVRLLLIALLCLLHWSIAGLDRGRLHWSDTVPLWLRIAALLVFTLGLALFIWAMHVNRFFSSVVRIQQERGHHVVTAGPYRWVRHPGYAGAIPAAVASGIALCSWLATALGVLAVPLLLWRTIAEDRMLRAELPGYRDYAQSVRWRLLPGVW
jgi:protein-S-isoprenylcysteine O-methyltransferase Ste14